MNSDRVEVEVTTNEMTDEAPLEDWEVLSILVEKLVTKPESVRVEEEAEKDAIRYVIYVAPEDVGKVIGKKGETVSLLRKLFGRIAASKQEKVAIDVFDPSKATPGSRRDLVYRSSAA